MTYEKLNTFEIEVDGDDRLFTYDGLLDVIADNRPEMVEPIGRELRSVIEAFADAPMPTWHGEIDGLGMVTIRR